MMGVFNFDAWKNSLQNCFDFGKSFDFSKTSTENMDKMWNTYAQLVHFMHEFNRTLNDNMTTIAEKYTYIARRNMENLMNLTKENTQSLPTPQRMMEKFQESMEKSMQDAKDLAELYTRSNMQLLEMYQNQFKNMGGKCYETAEPKECYSSCQGRSGKK